MIRIGTAGWSIPGEFQSFFPAEGSHLERYSRVFNCVEINSTFNKIHRADTFEKWASVTPSDFEFSLKLHRSFTHNPDLKYKVSDLKNNIQLMSHLGPKWTVLLLQFPGKLEFNQKKMSKFYEVIRKNFSGAVVVEPRNLTWLSQESKQLLKEYKISKVVADPERCPHKTKDVLKFGGISYFRLHGSPEIYKSSYSKNFLKDLAKDLNSYKNCWCIFDNTTYGKATGNALTLHSGAGVGK